ncbi:MAG: hypothetical protein M3460_23685 [Actinomycetota bacterium]|nr:hypothetical protein [Actinomycetota bacterium]
MLRIYLDQNKWIDLARARTGHASGKMYIAAYEAAKAAVEAGSASFPLSSAHYFEAHKQAVAQRRVDLARTMLELSRLDAIAPPHVIVPYEIEAALIEVLGLAYEPPQPLKLFGHGANHVHATDVFTYTAPDEFEGHFLAPDLRNLLTVHGQAQLEFITLADCPEFGNTRIQLNKHMRLTVAKFVDGQNTVRDRLEKLGHHRLGDMMTATAILDIVEPLLATAERLEVDLDRLSDGGRKLINSFVEAMPSRWVEKELRRLRQSNPQKRWEGNDLNDVTALSIAVPYCDVVITERSWTAMLNSQKINARFNTQVLHDLRELPDLLQA